MIEPPMIAALIFIGALIGILLTVITYGTARTVRQRRLSRARRERFAYWSTVRPVKVRPGGSIGDYLEGERARPFNPNTGPRDW